MLRTNRHIQFGLQQLCLAIIAAVVAPEVTYAQSLRGWTHSPNITVVAKKKDPRLALVKEALTFWNQTLEEIGSGFRLGGITVINDPIPEEDLQRLSSWVVTPQGTNRPSAPASLLAVPGDLIIYLAQSQFVSFASWFSDGRRIVAIPETLTPPLNQPNVARNIIAHEIGHAVGLGHNADPTLLMCGLPPACRPSVFRSSEARIFPLSDEEKQRLLEMYPPNWRPRS
jgi:hypothetical protein